MGDKDPIQEQLDALADECWQAIVADRNDTSAGIIRDYFDTVLTLGELKVYTNQEK